MRVRFAPLLLAVLLLAGCATQPGGAGATKAAAPVLPPAAPLAGRVRDRAPSLIAPDGGVFDFGGGKRVVARDPRAADEPDEPAPSREPARGTSAGSSSTEAARGPDALSADERRALAALDKSAVAAHGVRITWEALAVERDLILNPRLGRRPQQGAVIDGKIVLVSDDHPAAKGREKGCASVREKDGSQVAVLAGEDLREVVRALKQIGFYEVARPTGALERQFDDAEARGRVTVEVDGSSRTLLSERGQGTQSGTRDVPRIYSQAKQAVVAVRNQTPTLSVATAGGQPGKPRARLSRQPNRTLTEEEAAQILGEEKAAKPTVLPPAGPSTPPAGPGVPPVDDGWGLGR